MVTEKQYFNALAIVAKYVDEQRARVKATKYEGKFITMFCGLESLYFNDVISSKLRSALETYHKYTVLIGDNQPPTLAYYKEVSQSELGSLRGVGKKTVDEFVDLMAAAGHVVPID